MKRYAISRKRVMNALTGKLVGHIVRMSDGTTYFEQAKTVRVGARANFGPRWERP